MIRRAALISPVDVEDAMDDALLTELLLREDGVLLADCALLTTRGVFFRLTLRADVFFAVAIRG